MNPAHLLALGLNHRTAPVAVRERASFSEEQLSDAVSSLVSQGAVTEAAILSTCNRTEVYCRQDQPDPDKLVQWLCDYSCLRSVDLDSCLYQHPGENAVKHAFRVASGLDSMVLGEAQILGQMKQAFVAAHRAGATGKILNRLFQQTFSVAKQVRTDTAVGASAVSVAFAAVDLAKRIFSRLAEQTVLLVGAGETIELVARHLKQNKVKYIIVANRTIERAQVLAKRVNSEAIALAELPKRLQEADILVTSTASTLPLIGKGLVERALKQRKHRPMFIVDLAVPRDVEAEVSELRDVYLYTVDDLQEVVKQNTVSRKEAAEEAEKIIDLRVVRFMRWLKSLDSIPTICALRSSVETIGQHELERARQRLYRGDNPNAVIEQLTWTLIRKFTHQPSAALREADIEADPGLLGAARKLFDLKK